MAVSIPMRPQYTMNVVMDYDAHSITADETIVYPNHTGQTLNDMVLAVEPNYWTNCFTLDSMALNGNPFKNYILNSHKLSFDLPQPLPSESVLTIHIQFHLALPPLVEEHGVRPQIFGYASSQMNLTDWYPFVVPFIGGQWILHDRWYYGEHLVYDAADFSVNLKFTNPINAPVVASSGAPTPNGEWTRYTLVSGRTFVISASRDYKVMSAQAGDAVIYAYYFPLYDKSAQASLMASVQAMQVYAQHYGTPYSHETFSIVMGDFNDGMEFSGLVFMPRSAYNLYNGTPESLLITVTVHETAHQWWFEQVADDQALQPWLDEAFAAYSEHVFYASVYPDAVSWWWAYWYPRVGGTSSLPWVDISIYDGGGFIPYTNTVYLGGAHFLDDLRIRLGDQAFFAFLQDYLKQESGKITTSAEFFRVLHADTQVDFSDLEKKYFKNSY
ncbi:MAG TPA: M1 family aminopeptidase [Anaerolineales bacterium]|nr:M1 family aminopeptidase [Anaerolineales bacterium]